MTSMVLKPEVFSPAEFQALGELEVWIDLYPLVAFERRKVTFVLHHNPTHAIGTPIKFQVRKSGYVTGFQGFRNKFGGEPVTDVGTWNDGIDIYMVAPRSRWSILSRKPHGGDICKINEILMYWNY